MQQKICSRNNASKIYKIIVLKIIKKSLKKPKSYEKKKLQKK